MVALAGAAAGAAIGVGAMASSSSSSSAAAASRGVAMTADDLVSALPPPKAGDFAPASAVSALQSELSQLAGGSHAGVGSLLRLALATSLGLEPLGNCSRKSPGCSRNLPVAAMQASVDP